MIPRLARSIMLALAFAAGCAAPEPEPADDPEASGKGHPPSPAPVETAASVEVPTRFTNLQLLPPEIGRRELLRTMKRISRSLGAKCDFCHLTDVRDFASDEREHKRVAREMMQMVDRLNTELFTWENAPTATCFMCHRGDHEPALTLADAVDP